MMPAVQAGISFGTRWKTWISSDLLGGRGLASEPRVTAAVNRRLGRSLALPSAPSVAVRRVLLYLCRPCELDRADHPGGGVRRAHAARAARPTDDARVELQGRREARNALAGA